MLLQVDIEIARRIPMKHQTRRLMIVFSLRRLVSSSCELINRIMAAKKEHGAKAHPLTHPRPSSSACFLCMGPLSVAATESAIINTAVHKTELSAWRGSRFFFFFQKAHAAVRPRTYIYALAGVHVTLAAAIIIRYF